MIRSIEDKLIDKYFQKIDKSITSWMAVTGIKFLRIGLGIVFFWFGMLKFFPVLNPL